MVKHKTQKKVHQIKRPVPNLIPIPILKTAFIPDVSEPEMSQKELTEICRKSTNSSLKDLASLFSSEDLITPPFTQPQNNANNLNNASTFFKKSDKKNASFFDNLRAKLNLTNDLICKNCRYESKCLTEHAKHVQTCSDQKKLSVMLKNKTLTNSTRCQYCRQRCKTSSDLIVHLQKCHVALQSQNTKIDEEEEESCSQSNAHPMENKIFIWNDIIAPIHVEEYQENTLDLSLKNTPVSGATDHNSNAVLPHPEKIPTHGNDIATAQHKRVFKCPHCTFWASTASRFHVHIVGHLNKKPFECSLCSYRSNWRWDITKHIKLKSVRDKSHETAKVLMTDETGRRNYTKYNKYLTEIQISNEQTLDTSGGCGTRPRSAKNSDATLSRVKTGDSKSHKGEFLNNSDMTLLHLHSKNDATLPKSSDNLDPVLPRLQKVPTSAEFGDIFKNVTTVRPLPDLVTVEGLMTKVRDKRRSENGNGKKTLFKCKKCNFKDVSRDVLLEHVKGHYQNVMDMQPTLHQANEDTATAQDLSIITRGTISDDDDYNDEASLNGNIASSTYGNGASISTNSSNNFNNNGGGNAAVAATAPFRCGHCNQVSNWKHVIQRHCRLKHHGDIRVVTTKNGLEKLEIDDSFDNLDNQEEEEETNEEHGNVVLKKFKCQTCPYVTNSKSQFVYHKQFHNKDKKGQYTCQHCTYNVSKRHLLHQHMKVHGINMASHRQNGDMIDPVLPVDKRFETQMVDDTDKMADIPLVWVSKNGKFTKMFKCRFCPHVNLRKVNITEHEKMHRTRTSNVTSSTEHKCSECNYVCNNAGVLSSHTKVHQGLYGTIIHKMVDLNRTDEEQIKEMTTNSGNSAKNATGKTIVPISGTELFLQKKTRAAILEQNGSQDEITDQDGGLEEEEEEFRCVLCPYSCSDKQKVAEHQQMHKSIGGANEMEYKCDHCDFQCDNAAQLAEHIDCHLSWNRKVEKMLKNSKYYMWSDAAITIKNETNEGEVIFEEKQNGDEEECKIELHEEKFIINNNNNDDGDRERCLLDFKHGNTVSVIKEEEESDMDVD